METAHIPAVFSKQGWLRPYIVQGSTVQYRLSVGPGGWTMVALERAADVLVYKRITLGLRIIFNTDIGWKYITSVQYTVPCGICGWKYITSVQYTVPCGRKWKYITAVQYSTMWL